jgi:hypothetical protein
LQRGGEYRDVGRKYHLQQATAEIGPVDSLARIGEQKLLDHVADVVVAVTYFCRVPEMVEVKW